ncbi:MAG TPA: hypothetical protein VLH94_02085 [Spirochaetia bacterium]|nr:hypothetical protein [Spirochaetia bacterium]
MRELRRLLDLNAGNTLCIRIGDRFFYVSHLIADGDESIRIEDFESKEELVSDKWQKIADFIYEKLGRQLVISDLLLYKIVLILTATAFLAKNIPDELGRKVLKEGLVRLVEEEPLLEELLKNKLKSV